MTGTAEIPHCSTHTAAGNEPALLAKKKQGKNRKIFVLMTMLKNSPNSTAHSKILGYGFPEYPTWDSKHTGKADLHPSPFLVTYQRSNPLKKNYTWGSISKLSLLLINKLLIWGMLTHLLNMTELVFNDKGFLKFKSRDAEENQSTNKKTQAKTQNTQASGLFCSWCIMMYIPFSICLFGPSFWNNAAREDSANCTCNFLSVLNSRQFQILLALLIWFSPTENPSVTLFHWQRKCCLICNVFPAFQISNLGSPHQSVCYFLLRNKPSSQP